MKLPKTSFHRAAPAALAVSLAITLAGPAQAEPPPPDAEELSLSGPARKLFEDGQAARKAGNFQGCYENALAAWKLHQTSGISGLIGDCAYELGRYRESAERLSWFFERLPDKPKPGLITYMQERLARAKERVATVTVTASVAGARIAVDGQAVEEKLVFVDPGSHSFEAQAEGYRPAGRTLELGAGSEREVALQLVAIESAALEDPPNGSKGSGEDDQGSGAEPWVLAVGYGTAAVLLVGGFVFTAVANGKAGDAEDELARLEQDRSAPCCEELRSLREEQRTFENVALWSFVGAGAVAVATTVYWLIAESGDARPSASLGLRPWVSAEGGGFGWSARW